MTSLRQRRPGPVGTVVAAVFAAGLALRVFFVVAYRPAFLGIADTGSYVDTAHRGLYVNVYDPAGYPLFIRLVHVFSHSLTFLIVVQHLLAIATAAILFLTVRRVAGSPLLGLVPAVVVLFEGYGIWLEHSPLTETLFTFLIVAGLSLLLVAVDGRARLLPAAGLLVGCVDIVRPAGTVLIAVVGLWTLWAFAGGARLKLLAVLAVVVPAAAVPLAYAAHQSAEIGFFGLNQDSGRVLYARTAGFADCTKFTPPAGTRALCERTPRNRRGSFNQYLTGFPDGFSGPGPIDRNISPAWRLFGPPPHGNGRLQAFGLAALTHQPGDYLSAVAKDLHYFWANDRHRPFIDAAQRPDPNIDNLVADYFSTKTGVHSSSLGFLHWYGTTIELTGPLVILLILAPIAGLLIGDRAQRRVAVLFAAAGWLVPLSSVATASIDPRFIFPSYGVLAAAAAIGLPGVRRQATSAVGWMRQRRAARAAAH